MENVIETENLSKKYGSLTAVDNINFKVKQGIAFGLLGPNGAGKTTTLKMMCTLIRPDSGMVKVAGFDVIREAMEVRRRIGYVSENPSFYPRMTTYETMKYLGRLLEVPDTLLNKRIEADLELVGLKDKKDSYVGGYSRGMRHRLSIAQALLSEPEVLFMDEPTLGLDPMGARDIRQLVWNLKKRDKLTIIMSSHTLPEVEQICDEVAVFNHGQLIAQDSVEGLRNRSGLKSVVEIVLKNRDDAVLNALQNLAYVQEVQELEEGRILVTCPGDKEYRPQLLQTVYQVNSDILSFGAREYSLEDILFKLLEE